MPIPEANRPAMPARQMLRDTVERRIHEAIMDGTLQPGEILHDKELQEWLGVSRTPIRDALNELTRAGLVEMSPNRYTRVAKPRDDDATTILQTLGVIFGGVVRLAVPLFDDQARAAAVAAIDETLDAVKSRDVDAHNQRAPRMFEIYTANCGNPSLIKLCRETIDGLAFRLRISSTGRVPDWDILSDEYTELRKATIAGDAIAAELATEAIHRLPRS